MNYKDVAQVVTTHPLEHANLCQAAPSSHLHFNNGSVHTSVSQQSWFLVLNAEVSSMTYGSLTIYTFTVCDLTQDVMCEILNE